MTSFRTWRADIVEKAVLGLLKQMLPNTKLQDFEESLNREIREIKPPHDGIAYACEYLMDMDKLPFGLSSGDIKIEQYWNKDGICIGFMFQGQKYMFDKEKLPERDRELRGQMTVNDSWNDSWAEGVVSYLTRVLPKEKLEGFKKHNSKENVIEHNPPFNGIAYSCAYRCHTLVSQRLSERAVAKSSHANIVQYWDKDGNCIGFKFQGREYMFDKEKLPEQGRDNIEQRFRDGQNRILSKVPENSELAKYLKEFPDAELKQGANGWSTELPKELYPDLFPFQRVRLWNKDGSPSRIAIKGLQKEM